MGQAGNDEELQGITRDCFQIQIKSVIPHFFGRELVIWGTRERAELAREVLSAFGLQCKFFISSRPKSDTFCGQPLYTPDVLDV